MTFKREHPLHCQVCAAVKSRGVVAGPSGLRLPLSGSMLGVALYRGNALQKYPKEARSRVFPSSSHILMLLFLCIACDETVLVPLESCVWSAFAATTVPCKPG